MCSLLDHCGQDILLFFVAHISLHNLLSSAWKNLSYWFLLFNLLCHCHYTVDFMRTETSFVLLATNIESGIQHTLNKYLLNACINKYMHTTFHIPCKYFGDGCWPYLGV